jgi:hypothetical protein
MSQALCVAAELGIPDLLAAGPRHSGELAQATGVHGPSLHRLMRALATLHICLEREDGSFELTDTGAVLRRDAPNSLRFWTILSGKYLWPLSGDLLHSVKTGLPARQQRGQQDRFAFLNEDKQAAVVFDRAMAELSRLVAHDLLTSFDFKRATCVVDVGGGNGCLLAAVLKANPHLRGVLFDVPRALQAARLELITDDLIGRCDLRGGDFFASVPAGGDVYLLKAILHDWDDEQSARILANCRDAFVGRGRLLLIERIAPRRFKACQTHHAIARMDLHMLAEFGGRERTEKEYAEMLQNAGFKLTRAVVTSTEFTILEAAPIDV